MTRRRDVQKNARLFGMTPSAFNALDSGRFDALLHTMKRVDEINGPIRSSESGFVVLKRVAAMLVGYARVSTTDQNLDLQKDALLAAGCERLFADTVSGAQSLRPGLEEALQYCRAGDTLVVWKLDRLGRSLPHLVETVGGFADRAIGFKSLQENIDTTSSSGKLVFHLFASLAEFERDIIRDRTKAGLSAARARGRKGGRPAGVDEKKKKAALALKKDPERSVKEICDIVGISRNTYYKYTRSGDQSGADGQSTPPSKPVGSGRLATPDNRPAPLPKVMKLKLWIQVENNSKFVRGKGKVREEIERYVLNHFAMVKADKNGGEYTLSVPYTSDEDLDRIIYEEIYAEAERYADCRRCFIEADMTSLDDPDRSW
jgi:DNA invertase Pin-like site-specific DNA recombinase